MSMKKNLYYGFWMAFINVKVNKYGEKSTGWQSNILLLVSHIFGLGLAGIVTWLQYFKIITNLDVIRTPTNGYNFSGILSFFITYTLVFYILNYFLVFYKKRYLKLMNKYEQVSKWGAFIFLMLTAASPFISIGVIYFIS